MRSAATEFFKNKLLFIFLTVHMNGQMKSVLKLQRIVIMSDEYETSNVRDYLLRCVALRCAAVRMLLLIIYSIFPNCCLMFRLEKTVQMLHYVLQILVLFSLLIKSVFDVDMFIFMMQIAISVVDVYCEELDIF